MKADTLLAADALVNLALGVLLIVFPEKLMLILGLPVATNGFYPGILGAVLFGIGIALLLQRRGAGGLGLTGAVAINLCGAVVLAGWLVAGDLALPSRGLVILWLLVGLLVGISVAELTVRR